MKHTITEKAGVKFTEKTREYEFAKCINADINQICKNESQYYMKDDDIINILKNVWNDINIQKYQEYTKLNIDETITVLIYNKQKYFNCFPNWLDIIYIIIFKNQEWSRGFNTSTVLTNEKRKTLIGINIIDKNMNYIPTILHELRHAYTKYINNTYNNSKNWKSKNYTIGQFETKIFNAFHSDRIYNDLKNEQEDFIDYRFDNNDTISLLINKWLYYLQDTEINSYSENLPLKFESILNRDPFACLQSTSRLIYRLSSNSNDYLNILKELSKLRDNKKEMDKWTKYNGGFFGALGLKTKFFLMKKDIPENKKLKDYPEKTAKDWVDYKIKRLAKMFKNFNIWANDYIEKYREKEYDIYISWPINNSYHIKTNIPSLCLLYKILEFIIIRRLNGYKINVAVTYNNHSIDLTFDNNILPSNILKKAELFAEYIIKKKNIKSEDDFEKIQDKLISKFDNHIIIK